MSSLRTLTLLCFAAATLLGCKPADDDEPEDKPAEPVAAEAAGEVFARQICASLFACECTTAEFASEAACIDQLSSQYQADIDNLLANGGTWDDACAGELVDAWGDWACLGPAAAFSVSSFDPRTCPVFKGQRVKGNECTQSSFGDSCEPGLTCVSAICNDAVIPVPVGKLCGYDWDQLPCESGSYCAYDEAAGLQICKSLPAAGDACDPNVESLCGPASRDLVCDPESTICEPAPGTGEPCFNDFLCGPGNYCDGGKDFTCQERFELGDGCGADAVCPPDASCVGNICQANQAAACSLIYTVDFF